MGNVCKKKKGDNDVVDPEPVDSNAIPEIRVVSPQPDDNDEGREDIDSKMDHTDSDNEKEDEPEASSSKAPEEEEKGEEKSEDSPQRSTPKATYAPANVATRPRRISAKDELWMYDDSDSDSDDGAGAPPQPVHLSPGKPPPPKTYTSSEEEAQQPALVNPMKTGNIVKYSVLDKYNVLDKMRPENKWRKAYNQYKEAVEKDDGSQPINAMKTGNIVKFALLDKYSVFAKMRPDNRWRKALKLWKAKRHELEAKEKQDDQPIKAPMKTGNIVKYAVLDKYDVLNRMKPDNRWRRAFKLWKAKRHELEAKEDDWEEESNKAIVPTGSAHAVQRGANDGHETETTSLSNIIPNDPKHNDSHRRDSHTQTEKRGKKLRRRRARGTQTRAARASARGTGSERTGATASAIPVQAHGKQRPRERDHEPRLKESSGRKVSQSSTPRPRKAEHRRPKTAKRSLSPRACSTSGNRGHSDGSVTPRDRRRAPRAHSRSPRERKSPRHRKQPVAESSTSTDEMEYEEKAPKRVGHKNRVNVLHEDRKTPAYKKKFQPGGIQTVRPRWQP